MSFALFCRNPCLESFPGVSRCVWVAYLLFESFSLCSVAGSIPRLKNSFSISKIVYVQSAVPFSTFRRTKRRKGKFGVSECVSVLADSAFVFRLVRLSCLFRICRVQNEPSAVLWAVCRLVPSRVRAVCSESGSGLLGLFYCWLVSYLIITVQVFNFQATNRFHLH